LTIDGRYIGKLFESHRGKYDTKKELKKKALEQNATKGMKNIAKAVNIHLLS